jgi:hypothetical protein
MYNYSPWTRLSYIGKNKHDNNKFWALITNYKILINVIYYLTKIGDTF